MFTMKFPDPEFEVFSEVCTNEAPWLIVTFPLLMTEDVTVRFPFTIKLPSTDKLPAFAKAVVLVIETVTVCPL
jgi:hypothetical protein